MNDLQIFENSEFGRIRTVIKDNEPWFVAKDISDKLGYAQTSNMMKRIDEEDSMSSILDGMNMKSLLINESGLYAAILGSKLESSKRFKHWVTSDVLPSIRKHGMYATDELISNPDLLIQVATALKEERERNKELADSVQQMDKVICDMTPKADYVDRILSSTDCMTITQIAQDYGMSAKKFNRILANACIQRKVGDQWILYVDHQGKGYVRTKTNEYKKNDGTTGTKPLTVWTQKGRMFIYQRLKTLGIDPDMERAS